MTDDIKRITESLRDPSKYEVVNVEELCHEAAALIERLEVERDEARQDARKAWLSGAGYQERAEAAEAENTNLRRFCDTLTGERNATEANNAKLRERVRELEDYIRQINPQGS